MGATVPLLLVMALGAQSLLVNNGRYIGAFCNSFAIGLGNLVLLKLAPHASGIEIAAVLTEATKRLPEREGKRDTRRQHCKRALESQLWLRSTGFRACRILYGLGADASNPHAVRKIFEAKGRPATHPVIVHLADAVQLANWAREVPEGARKLARDWKLPKDVVGFVGSQAAAATGTVGWWGYLGVLPLLTGLVGWCPPYAMFGFNTCAMKK